MRRFLVPKFTPAGNGIMLCEPDLEPWTFWIALDWGYSAPAICYLMGRSPGQTVEGRYYPRGSVLLLDEVCTACSGQPHVGAELSVEDVARLIKDMCGRWGVKPNVSASWTSLRRRGCSFTRLGRVREFLAGRSCANCCITLRWRGSISRGCSCRIDVRIGGRRCHSFRGRCGILKTWRASAITARMRAGMGWLRGA